MTEAGEHTTHHLGTLSFPSKRMIVSDPLYIGRHLDELRDGCDVEHQTSEIHVPGDAEVHYQIDPQEHRVARVLLLFNGASVEDVIAEEDNAEEHALLMVDTGQMSWSDAEYLVNNWKDGPYLDIRIYRHRTSGKTLQYGSDFAHYETPINSENGATMNALLRSGEWEKLPYSEELTVSYNGLCHCHEDEEGDGVGMLGDKILVSYTGYGDGQYALTIQRNDDDSIKSIAMTFIWEGDDDDEDYDDL